MAPPRSVTFAVLICAIAFAIAVLQWTYADRPIQERGAPQPVPQASQYRRFDSAGKPHQSSWGSWWHPYRTISSVGQGAGITTGDWNILYHLGGNGPWVEKMHDVVEGGIAVPDGCEVEQVHMMARHAERYPTFRPGMRMVRLLDRINSSALVFQGDLTFANDWQLFWTDDSQLEQLTSTGPFAGTLGSFTTGVRLRTRYENLIAKAQKRDRNIKFWAGDSQRVIDTARYFAAGFFGYSWQDIADLEIISEGPEVGANTLTPGRTCPRYRADEDAGHEKGYRLTQKYRSIYLNTTRTRLLEQNPDIQFNDEELYAMQEMCGFETTVRGGSHWCNVFTQDEFLSFEYARDLLHYYRAGPGTKYAGVMGWLWLNATTNLMLQGLDAGPLFFSFVHDGDIAPMLTALDIINDDEHLPITHISHARRWRKSQVSPMGGRIIFELLSCSINNSTGTDERKQYVRININDGITALPDCYEGPGRSCPLADFAARVKRKGVEVGDFRSKCGLGKNMSEKITFLHQ